VNGPVSGFTAKSISFRSGEMYVGNTYLGTEERPTEWFRVSNRWLYSLTRRRGPRWLERLALQRVTQ